MESLKRRPPAAAFVSFVYSIDPPFVNPNLPKLGWREKNNPQGTEIRRQNGSASLRPADKVERPKKQRYIADDYRQEELERLLEQTGWHT